MGSDADRALVDVLVFQIRIDLFFKNKGEG